MAFAHRYEAGQVTKIQVPEGMLKAAYAALESEWKKESTNQTPAILEAALQWLCKDSPNLSPSVCVHLSDILFQLRDQPRGEQAIAVVAAWKQAMFLAEPEIPEEVKDLISHGLEEPYINVDIADRNVLEAFRRGQRSNGVVRER